MKTQYRHALRDIMANHPPACLVSILSGSMRRQKGFADLGECGDYFYQHLRVRHPTYRPVACPYHGSHVLGMGSCSRVRQRWNVLDSLVYAVSCAELPLLGNLTGSDMTTKYLPYPHDDSGLGFPGVSSAAHSTARRKPRQLGRKVRADGVDQWVVSRYGRSRRARHGVLPVLYDFGGLHL